MCWRCVLVVRCAVLRSDVHIIISVSNVRRVRDVGSHANCHSVERAQHVYAVRVRGGIAHFGLANKIRTAVIQVFVTRTV